MFQKKTNIEIIGFKLMHFGFALVLSDIDLGNIDLLDTHLDLLDTNIPSNLFVSLQDMLKSSSRHLFKTSSIHVFKTSSRHVFKTSWRDVFKTSSRYLCKTSWRRLGRRKIVTLKTCWRRSEDMSSRRLQDVLKTNNCLLGKYPLSYATDISQNYIPLSYPHYIHHTKYYTISG